MAVSNICHIPPYTLELYGIVSNLTHRIYIDCFSRAPKKDCFFRWLAQPLVARCPTFFVTGFHFTVPRLDTPRAIDLQGDPEKTVASAGFWGAAMLVGLVVLKDDGG